MTRNRAAGVTVGSRRAAPPTSSRTSSNGLQFQASRLVACAPGRVGRRTIVTVGSGADSEGVAGGREVKKFPYRAAFCVASAEPGHPRFLAVVPTWFPRLSLGLRCSSRVAAADV